MHRLAPAILLLLALACDKTPATPQKPKAPGTHGGSKAPTANEKVQLPTTGSPQIQNEREDLLADVKKMEQDFDAGTVPERRFVMALEKRVDNLITVTEIAVDKEAVDLVRKEHAMLIEKQAVLDKRRADLSEGVAEVEKILAGIDKGERPPEGFTTDELKDRLGEKQEELRTLEKEDAELRAKMKQKEDLLAKGTFPPQSETKLTQELAALKELKERIGKLVARLN
jgi:hypothetical protein